MPTNDDLLLESLARFSKKQIGLAGQRYTPGIDPSAPNLEIAPLLQVIGSVVCGAEARSRFQKVLREFSEAWKHARPSCNLTHDIEAQSQALLPLSDVTLAGLRIRDTSVVPIWLSALESLRELLAKEEERWKLEQASLRQQAKDSGPRGSPDPIERIQSHIFAIQRCIRILDEEREFFTTVAGKVLGYPYVLLRGQWGTGKTHLLCDVTKQWLDAGRATLLVLAKSFIGSGDVLSLVADEILRGLTLAALIETLDRICEATQERALIIVDGINEGRRAEWKAAVSNLLQLLANKKHVGLIVSCRTPFEEISIEPHDLARFEPIEHYGFADQEFDAQTEFFRYYKLPLPEVPLLDEEFSRPLTLKLICESLKNLTGKKLREGFSGIASGQKGMTYVLESFVNTVGKFIEQEFSLPDKSCWRLLKGDRSVADKMHSGIAPYMAANVCESVPPRVVLRIIATLFPHLDSKRRKELLESLRVNGLLDEDMLWRRASSGTEHHVVYRLPYQRFSDHLIARHLLDLHLDKRSEQTIARSFARGSPLHRVFRSDRFRHEYARAGWAQALITEFPESVKRIVQPDRRELYFFLPRSARDLGRYFGPFINGLFWRDRGSCTKGTVRVVSAFLNKPGDNVWCTTIDAIVAVATKPQHPFNASRLCRYLSTFSMSERDRSWSEYLRQRYKSPSVHRLLTWAEHLGSTEMPEETAREMIVLLSLLLTTVERRDRDVATRALVLIGERYPRALFDQTLASLSFNDPYVRERMLAASYGVTMSLVDCQSAVGFQAHLSDFAKGLYRSMFARRAAFATHHVLTRDYALGVIRLALKLRPGLLGWHAQQRLSPPYGDVPNPFPPPESVTDADCKDGKSAIHMDFGNYTIGRLIPHRNNYDDKHPEYVKVRRQIEWRIRDLGFRQDDFASIDNYIARTSYRERDDGGTTDRYGKKYSWIAYFEMYGLRESLRALPDWRLGERTSDTDVDPSFPLRPKAFVPPLPVVFGKPFSGFVDWVKDGPTPDFRGLLKQPTLDGVAGPWVLVDGFIEQTDAPSQREIFTLLRGLFVQRRDVESLRSAFLSIQYPGNTQIPEGGQDHYVYAGEIGRSSRYAPGLLRKDGSYHRQTSSAFDSYGWEPETGDPTDEDIGTVSVQSADTLEEFGAIRLERPRGRSVRIPDVRVELPVRTFSWESYHSALNDFSGFDVLAPALIERLNLHTVRREINLRDIEGRLATMYCASDRSDRSLKCKLLYLREDLLRSYLRMTRQTMVWCNWGERQIDYRDSEFSTKPPEDVMKVMQADLHIHRMFVTLDEVAKGPVHDPNGRTSAQTERARVSPQ